MTILIDNRKRKRERINFTNQIVTDKQIKVDSDECNTGFINIERIDFPDIHELEKEVEQLRKELRQQGVSLYRTDTLKVLREQKEAYTSLVNDYSNTFDELVAAWKIKVKEGIYSGYIDDVFMNETLRPLKYKLEKMNYNDTLLTKIRKIELKVKKVKRELKYGTNYTKVGI